MQGNRRIELRTLVIASVASAAAAGITSQFWIRGTPIAAALTPLIITLVSELLHRPTEKLAGRVRPETDALAEASAAASPPAAPATEAAPPAPDPEPPARRPVDRRRIAWAAVLGTGLLAFAIGATALTVAELVAGGSIGKGDRATSLISGDREAQDGSSGDDDDRPRTVQTTIIRTVRTRPPPRDRTETAPSRQRDAPNQRQPDSRQNGGNGQGQGESQPPESQQTTPTTPDPTTTTPPREGASRPQQQESRLEQQSGGLEAGDGP